MYLRPRGTTHVYSSPVAYTHTRYIYTHTLSRREVSWCSTVQHMWRTFWFAGLYSPIYDILKSVWHHTALLLIPALSTEDTFRKSFRPANILGAIHHFPLLLICSSTYALSPLQMHLFLIAWLQLPGISSVSWLHFSIQRALPHKVLLTNYQVPQLLKKQQIQQQIEPFRLSLWNTSTHWSTTPAGPMILQNILNCTFDWYSSPGCVNSIVQAALSLLPHCLVWYGLPILSVQILSLSLATWWKGSMESWPHLSPQSKISRSFPFDSDSPQVTNF